MTEALKYDEGKPRLELIPPSYWFDLDYPSYQLASWFYEDEDFPDIPHGEEPKVPDFLNVLKFGADKYGDFNWVKGMKWGRMVGSFLRHRNKFNPLTGLWEPREWDELDEESNLPHRSHAQCCYWMLKFYWFHGIGEDDRPCQMVREAHEGQRW